MLLAGPEGSDTLSVHLRSGGGRGFEEVREISMGLDHPMRHNISP